LENYRKKTIFIDEAGFNLHLIREYGWSPRGMPANVLRPTARGRNISVLGAISSCGIIGMSVLVAEPNQAPAAETRGGDEPGEAGGDGDAVVEVRRGRGRHGGNVRQPQVAEDGIVAGSTT
ncbi:hypothetical protein BGZ79_006167, partial [Entomortierella chlamydospora]